MFPLVQCQCGGTGWNRVGYGKLVHTETAPRWRRRYVVYACGACGAAWWHEQQPPRPSRPAMLVRGPTWRRTPYRLVSSGMPLWRWRA